MYNRFKGDNIRIGGHKIHFDYVPDISTPRDAYRIEYWFVWDKDGERLPIKDIYVSKAGLAIDLDKDTIIIRMDGNELQRAIDRGKEAAKADMAWYKGPLP